MARGDSGQVQELEAFINLTVHSSVHPQNLAVGQLSQHWRKGSCNLFASNLAKLSMVDDDPLYGDCDWACKVLDVFEAEKKLLAERAELLEY